MSQYAPPLVIVADRRREVITPADRREAKRKQAAADYAASKTKES